MQKKNRKRRQPRGFSLLEIMVVLVLIGMVVSLVTVNVMGRLEDGKYDTASTQASQIAASLDVYKLQKGKYPSSGEGLSVLTQGSRPIMDKIPKDPWNNDYILACPGQKNPNKCDVRSKGGDGQEGTEDDVGNWPRDEK
jgi:general secretion pathway protein G